MTKKDKRVRNLFANPAPKDFRWEDLVLIMTEYGFEHECSGGSHYTFEHSSGHKFVIAKTHPNGLLKPYQVKGAKDALISIDYEGK